MLLRTICLFLLFSFFLKGLRLGVWQTTNLLIGGTNLTNINFANIGEQVKFINTMKYYQQSLSTVAATMKETEKQNIKFQCKKIINNNKKLNLKFSSCTQEEQEWILNYISSGKGAIPYEMITQFIQPEQEFFCIEQFYLRLTVSIIFKEEYEVIKKPYMTMKMENLGESNILYNFQNTIILCEIFESCTTYLDKDLNSLKFLNR